MIKIICCMDKSNAIGYKNKLLYHLPNDLKHFKNLTENNFVLFGTKTFESVLNYNNGNPLPNRTTVVLTRNDKYEVPSKVFKFDNVEQIIKHYTSTGEQEKDLWVCGGAKVYEKFMPYTDELHITIVDTITTDADTFFPVINLDEWKLMSKEEHKADEKHEYGYTFKMYKRIKKETAKNEI